MSRAMVGEPGGAERAHAVCRPQPLAASGDRLRGAAALRPSIDGYDNPVILITAESRHRLRCAAACCGLRWSKAQSTATTVPLPSAQTEFRSTLAAALKPPWQAYGGSQDPLEMYLHPNWLRIGAFAPGARRRWLTIAYVSALRMPTRTPRVTPPATQPLQKRGIDQICQKSCLTMSRTKAPIAISRHEARKIINICAGPHPPHFCRRPSTSLSWRCIFAQL